MAFLNKTVLMSGADYFGDQFAINAYMDSSVPVNVVQATKEHTAIRLALTEAGVKVIKVDPPANCQDGVYTANWALVRGNKALLSSLPNTRQAETPYAEQILKNLGKEIHKVPGSVRFSGQGDALPCGNYVFVGSRYRTDEQAWDILKSVLGYQVVGLQTMPKRSWYGRAVTNKETGWPDSFFYDIDLALAVLRDDLIAYCPAAFTKKSQKILADLPMQKILVDIDEARQGFACNLVSTGQTVVMSSRAPKLQSAIEQAGLRTITPEVNELGKGGGYIRCTTLTIDI